MIKGEEFIAFITGLWSLLLGVLLCGKLPADLVSPSGFADQDSFHPLLAQVTLNDSLEPSMTFHLPQQEMPSSPEGSHQSTGRVEAASTGESKVQVMNMSWKSFCNTSFLRL